jgi:hypothetical protein
MGKGQKEYMRKHTATYDDATMFCLPKISRRTNKLINSNSSR